MTTLSTLAQRADSPYITYLNELHGILKSLAVTDNQGKHIDANRGLEEWCTIAYETRHTNRSMFFIGNGASASMASHMAADFNKTCGCRALAFNDIALMTAVSNDIHYEDCFVLPLTRFADKGDMLVTISSSGNSPNVTRAIQCARERDLRIVTISAMKANNRSRTMGDLNFWIPASTYGLAEAGHQTLLHCWLDTFLEKFGTNDDI